MILWSNARGLFHSSDQWLQNFTFPETHTWLTLEETDSHLTHTWRNWLTLDSHLKKLTHTFPETRTWLTLFQKLTLDSHFSRNSHLTHTWRNWLTLEETDSHLTHTLPETHTRLFGAEGHRLEVADEEVGVVRRLSFVIHRHLHHHCAVHSQLKHLVGADGKR